MRNQKPLMQTADATVQAACKQMRDRRVGAVLVTNAKGQLAGIFTGRDALHCLAKGKNPTETHLRHVMTRNPTQRLLATLPSRSYAYQFVALGLFIAREPAPSDNSQ